MVAGSDFHKLLNIRHLEAKMNWNSKKNQLEIQKFLIESDKVKSEAQLSITFDEKEGKYSISKSYIKGNYNIEETNFGSEESVKLSSEKIYADIDASYTKNSDKKLDGTSNFELSNLNFSTKYSSLIGLDESLNEIKIRSFELKSKLKGKTIKIDGGIKSDKCLVDISLEVLPDFENKENLYFKDMKIVIRKSHKSLAEFFRSLEIFAESEDNFIFEFSGNKAELKKRLKKSVSD